MTSLQAHPEANLIHSVIKAMEVLDCLAAANGPLSAPEVGRRCGLSRPTAYRLLITMATRGYIATTEEGTYHLGPRVLSLGQSLLDSLDLLELSKPEIHELNQAADETTLLAILDQTEILYVYTVESSQPVRTYSKAGKRNPLYCTGLGKAVLAFLPAEKRNALLDQMTLAPRTAKSIVDKTALVEHLKQVQAQGFAIDDLECEDGVRCVGAPIFDYKGEAFAAVSVSGPAYRVTEARVQELAPLVVKAARNISGKLGYLPAIDNSLPITEEV